MSLNDVCCFIPAWFGVVASILVGLIAYEVTLECNSHTTIGHVFLNLFHGNGGTREEEDEENDVPDETHRPMLVLGSYPSPALECGVFAMGIMGMVPAHLTRSIGGGFDNESVAVSAMCLTFYFWVRSLRKGDERSYWFSILTGISYFYVSGRRV